MATIVEMINPLTGLPEQVDKLDHTAQEIDDAVGLAPQLSNPNLLDNWYFAYPVNRRNASGTIDAVGYFLDRWKLVSGSVTIGSNGITLNGTIVQILETAVGTNVTASALTTEGVVVASYDNNSKTISLTGTGQTFVAAKLELGSQQTLAHQENDVWVLNEIPNYGEQLRRCQRYDYIIGRTDDAAPVGLGTAYSETSVIAVVELPETMRANPAVSITGLVNLRFSESKNISVSSVSNYGFSGDKVQLYFSGLSGLTQGQSCDIYVQQGSKIEFNANL